MRLYLLNPVSLVQGKAVLTPIEHGEQQVVEFCFSAGSCAQLAIDDAEPIHLIVQEDSFVSNMDIDYHDGERYPVLERVEGTPDYLDDITKPLTVPEKAPAGKPADSVDSEQ